MIDTDPAISQESQAEPLERISFQVSRQLKEAVDIAVVLRHSTLRRECTEAITRHFGLDVSAVAAVAEDI